MGRRIVLVVVIGIIVIVVVIGVFQSLVLVGGRVGRRQCRTMIGILLSLQFVLLQLLFFNLLFELLLLLVLDLQLLLQFEQQGMCFGRWRCRSGRLGHGRLLLFLYLTQLLQFLGLLLDLLLHLTLPLLELLGLLFDLLLQFLLFALLLLQQDGL